MRGRTRTWAEEEPYQRPRIYKPLFSGLALALPILLVFIGLYLTPRRRPVVPQPRSKALTRWETGASARTLTIDGQSLRLGPRSRLERVGAAGLRLTFGQVRVQHKNRNLRLETEQVEIQPVGTEFEIHHSKGLTRVHLFTGSLRLRQRSDGQVFTLNSKQPEWPSLIRRVPTKAP